MDSSLQEMVDHYEITKVLKQYCNACDRCDERRMADVYLEDSWDDHGTVKAPGKEFARITTARIHEVSESMQHLLGQTSIDVKGDSAGAETYFLAVSRRQHEGMTMISQLGGRFVDTLQRDQGKWRIKHRVVVRDWSISLPLDYEWETTLDMIPGVRSGADPCFAALSLVHGGSAFEAP